MFSVNLFKIGIVVQPLELGTDGFRHRCRHFLKSTFWGSGDPHHGHFQQNSKYIFCTITMKAYTFPTLQYKQVTADSSPTLTNEDNYRGRSQVSRIHKRLKTVYKTAVAGPCFLLGGLMFYSLGCNDYKVNNLKLHLLARCFNLK